jgi:hypothetical protein
MKTIRIDLMCATRSTVRPLISSLQGCMYKVTNGCSNSLKLPCCRNHGGREGNRIVIRAVSTESTDNDNRSNRRSNSINSTSSTTPEDELILYQRDESRNKIPLSLFSFCSLNTTYWVWYNVDFVPALSDAHLQVDPSWGYAGLAIGLFAQGIVALYGISLVSSVTFNERNRKLRVCKHTLPLFRVSSPTSYQIGDLTLDSSSSDTKNILTQGIQNFQGHLGVSVRGSDFPLLIEVREPREVNMNPQLLIEILLGQSRMSKKMRTKSGARTHVQERSQKKRKQQHSRNAK